MERELEDFGLSAASLQLSIGGYLDEYKAHELQAKSYGGLMKKGLEAMKRNLEGMAESREHTEDEISSRRQARGREGEEQDLEPRRKKQKTSDHKSG
jgi:hypothetical protein